MANTTITPNVGAAALAGVAPGNYPSTAFLYVSEFATPLGGVAGGGFLPTPTLADQVIPYGAQYAVSAPFNAATRVIRIQSNGICAVKVGSKTPVAVAGLGGGARMTAGQTEFYAVNPGDALSVIATT